MPFLQAFVAVGLLAVGFALLAFRFARVAGLHALSFWVFVIALPFVSALTGLHGIQRSLVGNDLAGEALASALATNAHIYVAYALGLVTIAALANDADLLRRLRETLARQRFKRVWAMLFAGVFAVQILIALRYQRVVSGIGGGVDVPYAVSSLSFLATTLGNALFCYLSIFTARIRRLLLLLLPYCAFLLVTAGRREFLYSLIALLILRGVSVGFRLSWRFAGIAVFAVVAFVLVTPFFLQLRNQAGSASRLAHGVMGNPRISAPSSRRMAATYRHPLCVLCIAASRSDACCAAARGLYVACPHWAFPP